MTRVTHRSIQESTLANLRQNLAAMGGLQEQLSTGRRINRPSDDPTGTVTALQVRAELRAAAQHSRNADDGLAWLNATDRALQTASERLQKAEVLTLQALNSGTQGPASRAAIALEIRGIRDSMVSLANTRYLDRSVFAGTAGATDAVAVSTTTPPAYTFADTGTGTVERPVSAGASVRVDTDGRAIFGQDAEGQTSVFTLLEQIAVAATDGDPALSGLLGQLQARKNGVLDGLSSVGARQNRVEEAKEAAEDRKVTLGASLATVEEIDLPATIVKLQMQETAYKAALSATAKVLQPSLMDFLG